MEIIKKVMKISWLTILYLILTLLLLLFFLAGYHQIMLKKESSTIRPVGKMVLVDGFHMHVYAEGDHSKTPTLVIMSESGNPVPVYDYKILYRKLSDDYRVVVIEKFGYGYSDVSGLPRDVRTLVGEDRKALELAGESGPFVLLPHSMSALEAIYWADQYPAEVRAIIGLDMALPENYKNGNLFKLKIINLACHIGLQRIPSLYSVSSLGLSESEYICSKTLMYKTTFNNDAFNESKAVYNNAQIVKQCGIPDIPMFLFVTTKIGEDWIACHRKFAQKSEKIQLMELDCSHELHHFKSDLISSKIKSFLTDLQSNITQ
jgi:hypothetical protein